MIRRKIKNIRAQQLDGVRKKKRVGTIDKLHRVSVRERQSGNDSSSKGRNKYLQKSVAIRVVSVLAIAVLGIYLLRNSYAAPSAVSVQAENGVLSSDASTTDDSGASGGRAVAFSLSPPPTDLQVFTGGNNIALVWDMPAQPVKSIQVYRNGVQVATVAPSSNVSIQNQQLGNEYDDSSVTAGSTYQYKVRALSASGAASAFTPTVTVTQPKNSMPVPTITIDTSGISTTLANYMKTYIVPLLKTWYPKDADELAYPTYTPPTNLTINFPSNVAAAGDYCYTTVSGNNSTISCDPNLVSADIGKSDNDVAAVFIHESTHSIQDAANGPSWTIEGGASWSSDFFARQNINNYIPHAGEQVGPYTPGAWFIEYMREHYNANFPKDLNVAVHNNTYSDSLFSQDTGGKVTSEAQAWQAATSAYNSSSGVVKGVGGKCVAIQNGTVANGTELVLADCASSSDQQWALTYHNTAKSGLFEITSPALGNGAGVAYCMDDNHSGTADGTIVQYWGCDQSNAQYWTHGANGAIVNINANKCLATQNGSSANGTQLVIHTCDGSASQQWMVPS